MNQYAICSKCGGTYSVVEGGIGRCPNCGKSDLSSWCDEGQIMKENAMFFARKMLQVCRGKFRCHQSGTDTIRVVVKNRHDKMQVTNLAKSYAKDGYCLWLFDRYSDTYTAEICGFSETVDFDGYRCRPYTCEEGW